MFEPTKREVDSDIEKSMALFKRADVGKDIAIKPIHPKRVLLALDGSTQDELGVALAGRLKERLDCEIAVVDARTDVSDKDVSDGDATTLGVDIDSLGAELLSSSKRESHEQILDCLAQCSADLLIVPCPFARDFAAIGTDSTGTVIDLLLARSPVPMIVTRAPFDPEGDTFSRLRFLLTGENEAATIAGQWAVGLVHPEGQLELILLVEEEFYENVREAMHSIQPDVDISFDSLENALAQTHARLHAGLQLSARELGFGYKLIVERESEADPFTVANPAAHPPLLVLALERADHASQGLVHDKIRRSPHPVLVVHVD